LSRGPSLRQIMEYGETPYAHHNYLSGSSVEAIEFDFLFLFLFFSPGAFELTATERNIGIGVSKQRGLGLLWSDSSASKVKINK
jgi:hypothetical protein